MQRIEKLVGKKKKKASSKKADRRVTSCQKKMSAARKQIEESAEYKIFKTGSSAMDRKYGNADTRDILIRVGSAQKCHRPSFKIC